MTLSEEEQKKLDAAYDRVFDYDPSDEEVMKKYDKETNKRIDEI